VMRHIEGWLHSEPISNPQPNDGEEVEANQMEEEKPLEPM